MDQKIKKKIAIIGCGIFGSITALKLAEKKNYSIDIFEKEKDILNSASQKNQFRFHQGYHYPRSQKTFYEIKKYNKLFVNFFSKRIFNNTTNYYAIASEGSKTNFKKYLNFLKKNNLYFALTKNKDIQNVEGQIIVDEKNLNYFQIKKEIKEKLNKNRNINILYNSTFVKGNIKLYDKIIIASYSENQNILAKLGYKQKNKYKYELIEKIIIKLPRNFRFKSYIILDGDFLCLDPYLGTDYHLLSHVKYSKIEICNSTYPKFKSFKKNFIKFNKIKKYNNTNFKKFITNGKLYLPFLKKAKYIGSYFVVRCVSINKENTDERLSNIYKINNKLYSIFSGKWNTAVGIANKISRLI